MPYKSRTESSELLILKSLNTRMKLSEVDKQHYFNLKKGFEGELAFDAMTDKLQCDCFILNDLLLKSHSTTFQIDTLIIISESIYFYEVKNFEGNYYYENDKMFKEPKIGINNPITQINRSEVLLRQLIESLGFSLPISASVVFINPEFTLYQSPRNKPFIFPTQVKSHLKNLDTMPSNINNKQRMLADKLISLHIKDSPYTQIPPYEYNHLKKGNTCFNCSSFSISVDGKRCICNDCGYVETLETAVLRSVKEIKLLFPNQKITTNIVFEWCKLVDSKKRIKTILDKNFNLVGVHQWSFYE